MLEIEKAFQSTSSILFGKSLSGIAQYEGWLSRKVKNAHVIRKPSKVSGKDVWVVDIEFFTRMGGNIAKLEEIVPLAHRMLSADEVSRLTVQNAPFLLSKISTTSPEIIFGENFGTEESACFGMTQYCFRTAFCFWSKKVACSFWNRECDSVFGCSNLVTSSHCIKCHSSAALTRCFEVNDSSASSGCYYCHNMENCQDCMFCFNTKGKRYAIGNVEIGREAYVCIKQLVLASIVSELEATRALRHDIFNVGAAIKCVRP